MFPRVYHQWKNIQKLAYIDDGPTRNIKYADMMKSLRVIAYVTKMEYSRLFEDLSL